MVTFTCPWCDENELLTLEEMTDPELTYNCDGCGTAVRFADEPSAALDLAA